MRHLSSSLPPLATVFVTLEYFIIVFHLVWKIGLPVRSAVLKPHAGELVVGWVTTSESSLLYVFWFLIRSQSTLIHSFMPMLS
ncbi:L-lysine 2-3-aminomutase [Penicillium mononematosum]|uniref:L-lysine 2-3-aminomutase n=1 Tax=Penicillium mononematosum TaxID=268346 RepID=UPI002549A7CF|nr:L-lysine 2-3-aminomutase [Penicillium mononematosum]KAJ6184942.1 L-lysine 2-3-aminomutase [Penicillium mononematosum]